MEKTHDPFWKLERTWRVEYLIHRSCFLFLFGTRNVLPFQTRRFSEEQSILCVCKYFRVEKDMHYLFSRTNCFHQLILQLPDTVVDLLSILVRHIFRNSADSRDWNTSHFALVIKIKVRYFPRTVSDDSPQLIIRTHAQYIHRILRAITPLSTLKKQTTVYSKCFPFCWLSWNWFPQTSRVAKWNCEYQVYIRLLFVVFETSFQGQRLPMSKSLSYTELLNNFAQWPPLKIAPDMVSVDETDAWQTQHILLLNHKLCEPGTVCSSKK